MKSLKSLIILLLINVSSFFSQAQVLTVNKTIAARGDTIKCTLNYKFTNDSISCNKERRYFEIGIENGIPMNRFWVDINTINDSTTKLNFVVPKEYLDGSKIYLALRYALFWDIDGNPEKPVGCDSIFIANIVTVQGGDYNPTIAKITPSSFQRLDTITATFEFKGINFSTKTITSMVLGDRQVTWPSYSLLVKSIQNVNDSTMNCTFTVPYDIPNGQYTLKLSTIEWPYILFSYNQQITVSGNQPIPKIQTLKPQQIQRGTLTQVSIVFKSLELKDLKRIPKITADWAKIDSISILNDSTLSFNYYLNTIGPATYASFTVDLYEGQTPLYYAIPIVGGKLEAFVRLDKTYIIGLGQIDTLTLRGVNTHFKQGKLQLEFRDSLAGSVLGIQVIDSTMLKVIVEINPNFEIRNTRPQNLLFSDDESPIKTYVNRDLILVSESAQNRWWKMEPLYFYKNRLSTYYFHLLNDSIRLKSPADKWSLSFKGAYSSYEPQMVDCKKLNDSTIICQIGFQESFSDPFCSVDFRYNSTRVGLNIQSIGAIQMVATGIEERQKEEQSLLVYPNPTSGAITLNIQNKEFEPLSIRVIDISGKQIVEEKLNPESVVNFNYHLNIENGLYFLELKTMQGIYLWKISIQK